VVREWSRSLGIAVWRKGSSWQFLQPQIVVALCQFTGVIGELELVSYMFGGGSPQMVPDKRGLITGIAVEVGAGALVTAPVANALIQHVGRSSNLCLTWDRVSDRHRCRRVLHAKIRRTVGRQKAGRPRYPKPRSGPRETTPARGARNWPMVGAVVALVSDTRLYFGDFRRKPRCSRSCMGERGCRCWMVGS